MYLVLTGGADGGQAVYLIKEDDGGAHLIGLVKKQTQLAFALANPFAEAVRAFAHEEGDAPVPDAALVS